EDPALELVAPDRVRRGEIARLWRAGLDGDGRQLQRVGRRRGPRLERLRRRQDLLVARGEAAPGLVGVVQPGLRRGTGGEEEDDVACHPQEEGPAAGDRLAALAVLGEQAAARAQIDRAQVKLALGAPGCSEQNVAQGDVLIARE